MLGFILVLVVLSPSAFAQVAVSTPAATVADMYQAKGRDPMALATVYGDQTGGSSAGAAGLNAVSVSSFSIYSLILNGVMQDGAGRQALLTDPATAIVYKLKSGKLYDQKKKVVPGVSGVVKGKQVILMTEDKKVRQVNLREKE